jgi:hypothetical protein
MNRFRSLVMLASVGVVAVAALLLGSLPPRWTPRESSTASRMYQSTYDITVVNDFVEEVELQVAAGSDYTGTLQVVGTLPAGQSTVVNMATGGGTYYFIGQKIGGGEFEEGVTNIPEEVLAAMDYPTVYLVADSGAYFKWKTPDTSGFPTPEPPPTP